MRRLFPVFMAVLALLAACGDDTQDATVATTVAPTESTEGLDGELPSPGPELFTGAARLVNLYVDGAGETVEVDVWAHRSFEYGPVLLAEGVGFAELSNYFATPETMSVVIVPAGAGPLGRGASFGKYSYTSNNPRVTESNSELSCNSI